MQVNPMNSEEFEVNGRIFIRSTYLDITVLIDKETGYYYAQKICDDNNVRWRNLEQNIDYELMKQAVAATAGIPAVELEISFDGMPVLTLDYFFEGNDVMEFKETKFDITASFSKRRTGL